MTEIEPTDWLMYGGLALGLIFGLAIRTSRFCMVAAISNAKLIKDYRYAVALAVAMLISITGTQLLEIFEVVEINLAAYRNATLDWSGVLIGGLLFGIGASLAGGDASRLVCLAGEGSRSAWTAIFFFMIFATIAQFGLLETPRVSLTQALAISLPNEDAGLAALLSFDTWVQTSTNAAGNVSEFAIGKLVLLAVIASAFIGFIYWKRKHFELRLVLAAAILGLCLVASWYVTGILAVDEFADVSKPSGFTVSGPMSRFGSAIVANTTPAITLSTFFVIGILVSSLGVTIFSAIRKKSYSLPPFKVSAKRIAFGGILMGVGSTFAYGCNVGQGFSGLSTLSLESIIAVLSMIGGIIIGTRILEKND